MNPRICICCGEPLTESNTLSRNPNLCAFCCSLAEGFEESNVPQCPERPQNEAPPEGAEEKHASVDAEEATHAH